VAALRDVGSELEALQASAATGADELSTQVTGLRTALDALAAAAAELDDQATLRDKVQSLGDELAAVQSAWAALRQRLDEVCK
jgi:hypothetical protein